MMFSVYFISDVVCAVNGLGGYSWFALIRRLCHRQIANACFAFEPCERARGSPEECDTCLLWLIASGCVSFG